MLEKPIGWMIYFGTTLRYLQDAPSRTIKGTGQVLYNIDRFLQSVDELGFTVTRRAASRLSNFREKIDKATEARLSEAEVTELKEIMKELRPTLLAEAGGTVAYVISERRYPIEKLLDDPGSLWATDVFRDLPQLAQYDFGEAAKCLAFERPTAAAFHMLRATEFDAPSLLLPEDEAKTRRINVGPHDSIDENKAKALSRCIAESS